MATEIFGQSDAFGDIARSGPLRPLWFPRSARHSTKQRIEMNEIRKNNNQHGGNDNETRLGQDYQTDVTSDLFGCNLM
jgi:hypothetical protein